MNDHSFFTHMRLNRQSYVITESYGYNEKIPNSYLHLGLVVGEERVAVIDTGIGGTCGLRSYIEEVILGGGNKKPIVALLTHGHLDHIGAAMMFDERYLHENDIDGEELLWNTHLERRLMSDDSDLCAFANDDADVIAYCRGHYYRPVPTVDDFIPVHDGDVIDLGGVSLRVVEMPGHTAGSVAYYDAKNHVAYCGDSLSLNGPAERVCQVLRHAQSVFAPDSMLIDGHGNPVRRMTEINNKIVCCEEILNGVNLENDVEAPRGPGGPPFKYTKARAGIEDRHPRPKPDPTKKQMVHRYLEARMTYQI